MKEENARLKKALQEIQQQVATTPGAKAVTLDAPDLTLSLADLWAQRFDDNKYRAKQRLDQKRIRVTGGIDSVTARSITLSAGGTRFRAVTILAHLDEAYARQIQTGLLALEKGRDVSIQGRFIFDKMWLTDAVLVDAESGRSLSAEQVASGFPPAQ